MERLSQYMVPCLIRQDAQVSLMETSTEYPSPVSDWLSLWKPIRYADTLTLGHYTL